MSFDVIICGAGSAGAVLAARLSEDPCCRVALLEAGPDFPDLATRPEELKYGRINGPDIMRSQYNWQTVAFAVSGRTVVVGRGRVTGGSSAISGPTALRGLPEDYDQWAEPGNDLWSFGSILPTFRRLETDIDFRDDYHGADGPVVIGRYAPNAWLPTQAAFYQACRDAGHPDCPDLNHPQSTGVGPTPMTTLTHERWSTAVGYLAHARHRANLTIAANCLVRRVLVARGRAIGVEVERDGEVATIAGGEVVLCAGAVGSTLTLLRSGIGPAAVIRAAGCPVLADVAGVGQHLTDHPTVTMLFRTRRGVPLNGEAPLRQVALRYTASGSGLRNDMKVNLQSYNADPVTRLPIGISLRVSLALTAGTGQIRVDARGEPVIRLNYLADERDRQRLREGVRLCEELGAAAPMREFIAERLSPTNADLASEATLDRWLRREVSTSHHLAGTCRMGPSTEATAVVDQFGLVHGVGCLRVVDASVMRTSVRANTNLTTIMLGERMAELMRARRRARGSAPPP